MTVTMMISLSCYRRMLSAIVTIFLFTLILFIPLFLLLTTRWTLDPSTNSTIAVLSTRPDYPFHPDVPKGIIAIVTGVLMPMAVLIVIVSSVVIVDKLRAARKTRKEMANNQNERKSGQSEAKITQMLLSICFLFIILTLPETTGTLVNYVVPEFEFQRCYHNTFSVFFRIVSVASCLNSSVNFIAYVSLSGRFRTTLRQILHCPAFSSLEANISKPRVSDATVSHQVTT